MRRRIKLPFYLSTRVRSDPKPKGKTMKILLRLISIKDHGEFVMLGTIMFLLAMGNILILAPYLVKLTGAYMPSTLLAIVSTVKAVRDLFLTYLDHWSLRKAGIAFVISEVTFVFVLLIGYVNEELFIYVLTISVLFTGVVSNIYGILYDDHVSNICEHGEFKEIQLMERAWFSLANITTGGIATVIYAYGSNTMALTVALCIAIVAALFVVYFHIHVVMPLEDDGDKEAEQLTFSFLDD